MVSAETMEEDDFDDNDFNALKWTKYEDNIGRVAEENQQINLGTTVNGVHHGSGIYTDKNFTMAGYTYTLDVNFYTTEADGSAYAYDGIWIRKISEDTGYRDTSFYGTMMNGVWIRLGCGAGYNEGDGYGEGVGIYFDDRNSWHAPWKHEYDANTSTLFAETTWYWVRVIFNGDTGDINIFVDGVQKSHGVVPDANLSWIGSEFKIEMYSSQYAGVGQRDENDSYDNFLLTRESNAPVPDDYSFSIGFPSSGCSNGKGCWGGGCSACTYAYFEATELQGLTDENQLNPYGQTSTIAFMVIDNQSTTSTDFNVSIDLNENVPSTIVLKVSTITGGYEAGCSENAETGCIKVDDANKNITTVPYSASTQDKNLFFWSDFVQADVSSTDRNAALYTYGTT